MTPRDTPGDIERDIEKFRRYRRRDGRDLAPGAIAEGAFAAVLGLTGLVWLVLLWFTPDPVPSTLWMGVGMLGLVLFGLPAGAIYVLRRGGAETLRRLVREVA